MQAESPISSPDVEFYEECVIAEDDAFMSRGKQGSSRTTSPSALKANKDSGRVSKKSRCSLKEHIPILKEDHVTVYFCT